jgi:hypothetical protein
VETIAAKVRFHTFAAIGSLCSIGQIGLTAAVRRKLSKRLLLVSGAADPCMVSKLARERR